MSLSAFVSCSTASSGSLEILAGIRCHPFCHCLWSHSEFASLSTRRVGVASPMFVAMGQGLRWRLTESEAFQESKSLEVGAVFLLQALKRSVRFSLFPAVES